MKKTLSFHFATHPLNTLLEQTRDMSFPQGMNEFSRSMMWRHKLDTVDESIKFLFKSEKRC